MLRPLAWLIGLMVIALGVTAGRSPDWLLAIIAGLMVLGVLVYLGSHVYCLWKNPDALRSEKYALTKQAIEQGLIGDSVTGLFEPDEAKPSVAGDASSKQIEHKP